MSKKAASPHVKITIEPEAWAKAKAANSAACLISDAGKKQHPHLTSWSTDMATIRATDRALGVRYVWLTPVPAQDLLLCFDQGWSFPENHTVTLNGAVKVTRIKAGSKKEIERKRARLAELEAKSPEELNPEDRRSLAKLKSAPERPTHVGPVTDFTDDGTIIGGQPPRKNPAKNPNMLAGRTRTYGAKLATPSIVFQEAVQAEVAEHIARLAAGTADALESDATPTADEE